ncbi:NADH oxidase [Lentilactobacillus otakiensis]|mgnify:CR=1 FL=1|uniref:2,4-dienoyl-CoA reductase n=1 Tax=Lentilactobacillus otakiensis DSM 19908 = JCM 15040 TaxID=1423780 RepID=S4NE34_9LACO|nr:2,4-dienoyl-CoA reductase [Lentilactobacillus otakiensis]KRL12091.1 2,4-dienoyl-CoA reductase [Lentilactobacillus otakiensis DSM 19908 = JCM 15040]MBZ3777538.1 NADH oxidase [Lentilactobacillus otakiensis]MDV3517433.1 NADH oxidase [Lentilactobacillus otakiensis]GAD17134.1 2,4-dienoyl-CoA reductase [Lentilactobacillus otakiensis DSM 19908 = JCM 15040]
MNYLQVAKPLTLTNGQRIKNRFFKSAMSETMAENHQPDHRFAKLYGTWAAGGSGVIVTGNVMVDHRALAEPGNVVVEDEGSLPMLQKWAEAGTRNHTQLWMQLNHPGKQSPKYLSAQPAGPSAIRIDGPNAKYFNVPRALTNSEIYAIIDRFVHSAEIAQKAGFTGVQIHGAFGYLVNQFLSQKDNQRTDEFGGSIENRMRFLIKIYQGIREACGAQFAISLKLSVLDLRPDGFTEHDSIEVVEKMAELGIDLIEIAGDDYEDSTVGFSGYAHMLRQLVNVPIVLSGGFRTISTMEEAIGRDDADMIGICTPMVVMPDLPNRILNGAYQAVRLPLTMGSRRLDEKYTAAFVIAYCEQQARRIASGKQPQLYSSGWRALAASVAMHGPEGLIPRRAQ